MQRFARIASAILLIVICPELLSAQQPAYITTNPHLGTPVPSSDSRVSPYSPYGARNAYTTGGGRIYGQDGQYLGRLNSNKHDPESVANPYGRYGSAYSPNSINNPHGRYGSPHSSNSARNPYASSPPVVIYQQPRPRSQSLYGQGQDLSLGTTLPRYCNRLIDNCD